MRKKIRAVIATAAVIPIIIGTTGCTPDQVQYWLHRRDAAIATADMTDDQTLITDLNAVDSIQPKGTDCEQWFWYALEAGFTVQEWVNPVSWIMERESNCLPYVVNHNGGASGLMQVMPMWADDCGGTPTMLLDPMFNLRCAVHIKIVQGWPAWSTFNG